ncbi:MAG: hypothetical protein ACRDHG_07145 [Anaerolineales bacterium]
MATTDWPLTSGSTTGGCWTIDYGTAGSDRWAIVGNVTSSSTSGNYINCNPNYIYRLEPYPAQVVNNAPPEGWTPPVDPFPPEAEQRARALLEELFGAEIEPTEDFMEVVSGLHPGRRYRIPRAGMVQVWDGGQYSHKLCAGCQGLPEGDSVIARRLLLELNEAAFLQTAVRHYSRQLAPVA